MRPDGTRVKEASTIVSALPYVMPRRYDAQNFITEYADMEVLRRYIQEKRREGVRIPYMTLILAAYFKAYQEKEAVAQNQVSAHNNNTDKFANFLFAIPILPGLLFGLVKLMDRCGLLPRKIIDLSPFHTSLFITNLASINTNSIFHHCYEFGTTGVFVSMGKPIANYMSGEYNKKMIPLSVVMDERICTGHEYALFWASVRRYLKHPELLEGKPTEENAYPAEECV